MTVRHPTGAQAPAAPSTWYRRPTYYGINLTAGVPQTQDPGGCRAQVLDPAQMAAAAATVAVPAFAAANIEPLLPRGPWLLPEPAEAPPLELEVQQGQGPVYFVATATGSTRRGPYCHSTPLILYMGSR